MGECDEGGTPPPVSDPLLSCVTWFHKFSLHMITRKLAYEYARYSKSHLKLSSDNVFFYFTCYFEKAFFLIATHSIAIVISVMVSDFWYFCLTFNFTIRFRRNIIDVNLIAQCCSFRIVNWNLYCLHIVAWELYDNEIVEPALMLSSMWWTIF